jgi:hypothetical protein
MVDHQTIASSNYSTPRTQESVSHYCRVEEGVLGPLDNVQGPLLSPCRLTEKMYVVFCGTLGE